MGYLGIYKDDGSLREFGKAPKSIHIVETTKTGNEVGVLHHHFERSDGKVARDFTSHCGYDRGPKLLRIIKTMLEG